MGTIFTFAILPLLCLLGLILVGAVIYLLVRSLFSSPPTTRPESITTIPPAEDVKSQWVREHLPASPPPTDTGSKVTCPACGGENPTSASECVFCGRKLSLPQT